MSGKAAIWQFWIGVVITSGSMLTAAAAWTTRTQTTNEAQDKVDTTLERRVQALEASSVTVGKDIAAIQTDIRWLKEWAQGKR